MRVDILGLEAFIMIAELGSFRRAAVQMNLSQTALSHRIRRLEEDVGVPLLTRTTRIVGLTRAGQEFFPQASELLARLSGLYDALKDRGRQLHERVLIGCLPSLGELFLPAVLPAFRKRYPGIKVQIFDQSVSALTDLVAAGEAEFAITALGASHWALDSHVLLTEEFCAACPIDHPLANRDTIDWSELAGHPLARLARRTSHGLIIDESLGPRGSDFDWQYELQRTNLAASLVAAGLAISILPRSAIPPSERIRIVSLANPAISRSDGLISRRGVPLTKPAQYLRRLVCRHAQIVREERRRTEGELAGAAATAADQRQRRRRCSTSDRSHEKTRPSIASTMTPASRSLMR